MSRLVMMLFVFFVVSSSVFFSKVWAFELGVGVHIRHYPDDPSKYITLAQSYGFNSFREDFLWNMVEKEKGVYKLNGGLVKLNDFISGVYDSNSNSLLILNYGSKIYTNNNYPITDSQIEAFANYAYWTASKYKGRVKYYEIWNEWLVGAGVPKQFSRPSNDVFLKLVKATSEKIRNADPHAIILAGSLNPLVARDRKWMIDLVSKGILEYIDGISVHPYSYMLKDKSLNIPRNNLKYIDDFESELKSEVGKDIPIYITEIGYPTHEGVNAIDEYSAANWILEYSLLAKNTGYIKGIWWYDLINDGNNLQKKENNFGFFKVNLEPKLSAIAMKRFSSLINDYELSNTNNDKKSIMSDYKIDNNLREYTLENKNKNKKIKILCPDDISVSKSLCRLQ